ncbi:SET domain-containing protein-lysine N-methyltransferase [Streptomyces sp. DSM 44915]|uniref:SET domain-containing protein-lysine N-methyltransferase n=1 Tax=Streptomyces chisholmiae TaxID=3075540 RepID=A0ABU2JU15_9ACTN|nr:SET domain-containing protein-lysine N-methyltransferase [Streptomyces sp. DSM 44915]MDT0268402.1 SET domain-containing protein-lysine N-methyltransferase [Streptomyces sp. DSM 44915]
MSHDHPASRPTTVAAPDGLGPVPAACWLHPDAEVRPSPIAGRGLFARAPLAADTVVERLGGRLIDGATLAGLTRHDSLSVGEDLHLLLAPDHPVRFGNHSCDPTLWHRDALTVVARRDIAAGEELTLDYATLTAVDDWALDCRCGADRCRGRATGLDWRRPELRAAYGRHWTPPLLARIDAATAHRPAREPTSAGDADPSA